MEKTKQYQTIDEYINLFPEEIQSILQSIRQTIREAAPEAQEAISYQMPTFKLNGNLVHFAAFKNHIGFFPTPSGITKFSEELKEYETAKGTIRFLLTKPIPYGLISEIVTYRVIENSSKKAKKTKSC